MKMEHPDNWPHLPDGTPEPAALLEWSPDFPAYGGLSLSQLEAFGIPALTDRPGIGQISFLYTGGSFTGIRIFVPQSRLEEAKQILSAPAAEFPADEE